MKAITLLLTVALSTSTALLGSDSDQDEKLQEALIAATHPSVSFGAFRNDEWLRKYVLEQEKRIMSEFLTEKELIRYMKYFERGVSSPLGELVMIDGEGNSYLELAFQKGQNTIMIYTRGYHSGVFEGAKSVNQSR